MVPVVLVVALLQDLFPPEFMTTANMRQMPSSRRQGGRDWVVYHANLGGHRDAAAARGQKMELLKNEEAEIFEAYAPPRAAAAAAVTRHTSAAQRARVCECW